MALFSDMPKIKKNSFTIDEAADVFAKLAEKAKADDTPKQVVDTLIRVAEIIVRIIAII